MSSKWKSRFFTLYRLRLFLIFFIITHQLEQHESHTSSNIKTITRNTEKHTTKRKNNKLKLKQNKIKRERKSETERDKKLNRLETKRIQLNDISNFKMEVATTKTAKQKGKLWFRYSHNALLIIYKNLFSPWLLVQRIILHGHRQEVHLQCRLEIFGGLRCEKSSRWLRA